MQMEPLVARKEKKENKMGKNKKKAQKTSVFISMEKNLLLLSEKVAFGRGKDVATCTGTSELNQKVPSIKQKKGTNQMSTHL